MLQADHLADYADGLIRQAMNLTHDLDQAQDLVQQTLLIALIRLKNGAQIQSLPAYLSKVLRNRFYLRLREKYRMPQVCYDVMPEMPGDDSADEAMERSEEYEAVRRAISFLCAHYREVICRYYLRGESVSDIARALGIPKGTVLSRLDAGRNKIREGVENMEAYADLSYKPGKLEIGISGRQGLDREPFSDIKSMMEQNILLAAYEKPLSVGDISSALGIPAAYIEEAVGRLVRAELMRKEGTRVYTDFVISKPEDRLDVINKTKDCARETFDAAAPFISGAAREYLSLPSLDAFSSEQRYMTCVLSLMALVREDVLREMNVKAKDFEEYPDRPNYGKWYASGRRETDPVSEKDQIVEEHSVSGLACIEDLSGDGWGFYEWDTPVGRTHNAHFRYCIDVQERARILQSVYLNRVTTFDAQMLEDFERLGMIHVEGGAKALSFPVMAREEYEEFKNINKRFAAKMSGALAGKIARVAKECVIRYPRHIKDPSDMIFTTFCSPLTMSYIYAARDNGVIALEGGRNYPVLYMVKK